MLKKQASKSVFDHDNYKDFLRASFPPTGEGRGSRTRLAAQLNCQPGLISQILSGESDFSPEHAISIAELLKLSESEREYFMLLLSRGRAGSKKLTQFYDGQIQQIQTQRKKVVSRLNDPEVLDESALEVYYGRWQYTAVHMCALVPKLATPTSASQYLGLPLKAVKAIFEELESFGLLERKGDSYQPTKTRLHLEKNSQNLRNHHNNWRMAAMRSLERDDMLAELHFSSVMSISRTAYDEINRILLTAIQTSEPVIKEAKDEGVFALNIDLFEVGDPEER